MSENKRAVVYARYSSRRQGEQSIEGQLSAAYKYASEHDIKIVHEYIDRAATGRNDNREQFQAMLRDTGKGQFDTIILWKIDRFGRNREEIAFNKYRCKKNGVNVVYVAESIPEGAEGVILESVLEGMAEYFSLQLSCNVVRGQRASAEKCQSTGGSRILGYKTNPDTKKFEIDPDTAPTVRTIFDMYAKGFTISEIINDLNSKGLRTARKGAFTKNSLRSLLKNEKYIGIYSYNNEIRIEGGIPALIDKETFDKVQSMLKTNRKASARTWSKANYLLTDKIFCGNCGSNMIGESGTSKLGRKYTYYICSKKKKEKSCNKRAIRQDAIESAVINKIVEILRDDDMLNFIADGVYAYYQKQNTEQEYIEALKRQIADVEKGTANLVRAIEAGIFNDTTKRRMDELDAQRAELEEEISQLEKLQAFQLTRDHIMYFLCSYRDMDLKDANCQKRLIDTFVNSIFVYEDGRPPLLTFNYSGDNRTVKLSDTDHFYDDVEVFVYSAKCSTITHTYEPLKIVVYRNVFAIQLE